MSGYYKDRMGSFSFVFREGLEWADIDWVDNGECLDLIEKVSTTVLIKRVSQIVSLQHMIISLLLGRYLDGRYNGFEGDLHIIIQDD